MKIKTAFKIPKGREAVLELYDLLLENWPIAKKKINVQTRFGNTFIIECGEKSLPPLILLHGMCMNSSTWRGEIADFVRHYRVYAVDIPGEPGKSDEKKLSLKNHDYSEWLYDVFNALNIDNASLVGMSLGAWMSVKFSVDYPIMVKSLVLLCPAGIVHKKPGFILKSIPLVLLGDWGLKKIIRMFNGNRTLPEDLERFYLTIIKCSHCRYKIPLFEDMELKQLHMPIALFAGDRDVFFNSMKTAIRLRRLIPHAAIDILPDIGHTHVYFTNMALSFLTLQQ